MISATAVYLDGKEVYSVSSGAVNTYISVAKGSHHITIQSTNTDRLTWGSTVYVTTPEEQLLTSERGGSEASSAQAGQRTTLKS